MSERSLRRRVRRQQRRNRRRHQRRTRPPASLPAIAISLLLPTIALVAAWGIARAQVIPPTPIVTPDTPPPGPVLRTDLMSFRRSATLITAEVKRNKTIAATEKLMARVTSAVGPGSCVEMVANAAKTQRRVAAKAEVVPVVPASNQKLLTAYTALRILGPDHTYVTEVWAPAPVDGVVNGDLFIVGGGDPLLSTSDFEDPQRFDSFNRTSLDELADAVVAAGVKAVTGSIVGDGSRYDDEFRVASWGSGIGPSEGGPYDALLVNDSSVEPGEYALEPNRAGAVQFRRLLTARGVLSPASGNYAKPDDPAFVKIASVSSRPMTDVLAEMLQSSDNNTAEMVMKEIGFVAKGVGSRQAGLDTVWETLSIDGIPLQGVLLADGSGLSRENRVTCDALAALMRSDTGHQLVDLLPVAARSGTLKPQLKGTPAAGKLHAKTGTLSGVKALTGQMPDRLGRPMVFSLVLNGEGANDADVYGPVWKVLVETIAAFPPQVKVDPTPFEPLPTK